MSDARLCSVCGEPETEENPFVTDASRPGGKKAIHRACKHAKHPRHPQGDIAVSEIAIVETEQAETPALVDMTREEAVHALSQLRGTEERQKQILLDLHERKGYKALSYATWEEFAERELGITVQYFNRLLLAAQVERNLETIVSKWNLRIPVSQSMELAKLPTPELQAAVYQEAIEAAPSMTYRGKESRENGKVTTSLVANIVKRTLEEIKPKAEPPVDKPSAMPSATTPPAAKPKATPPSQKPTVVTSFTPAPDPEPQEETSPTPEDKPFQIDFSEVILYADTLKTWAENEQKDGSAQDRKWMMGMHYEIGRWIESEERSVGT